MGSIGPPTAVRLSPSEQDILRAAKGGGIKFAGSILARFGALAIAVILTRFLGVVQFGQYRLGVVLVDLLAQVGDLGLRSSSLRFIPLAARGKSEARLVGIVRVTCGVPLPVGLLLAALVFGLAEQIAEGLFQDRTLAPLLRLLCLAVPLTGLIDSAEAVTRAFNRIDYSVLGRDVAFPLSKVVITLGALIAGYGLLGAGVAHLAALLIAALLLVFFVHRLTPILRPGRRSRYPLRDIWRQSFPIYLTRLLEVFGGRLEILVLGFFGMTVGVGLYAAALQMAQLGTIFFEALMSVSRPIISGAYAHGGAERLRPLLQTVTKWAVMVTLPLFLTIVIFAELLLAVFGEEFTAGRTSLVLLGFVPLVNASGGMNSAIIAMTGKARLSTVNAFVFFVTKIVLSLLLIPNSGVVGAAIATVVAACLLNGLRLIEVFLLFRLWPYDRSYLKPIGAGVAAAIAAHASQLWIPLPHPVLQVGLGILVLAVVYLGILMALGFSAEDRMILDRLLSRLRPSREKSPEDPR